MSRMLTFEETYMLSELRQLPRLAQVGFSAACATRLSSACHVAVRHVGTIPEGMLEEHLADIWAFCDEEKSADWRGIAARIEASIPTEDQGSSIAYEIIDDALAAAAYAIRCIYDNNPRNAVWAAQRAYNATDRFVAEQLNLSQYTQEMEARIIASTCVQIELEHQKKDLEALGASVADDLRGALKAIRLEASTTSVVPLAELQGFLDLGR